MAVEAHTHGFDSGWTVAVSGAFRGDFECLISGKEIEAIDALCGHTKASVTVGEAVGADAIISGSAFSVTIVLIDEDMGLFQYHGHIHSFKNRALVGAAVTVK